MRSLRTRLTTCALVLALSTPALTWALPEVDVRSQARGAITISAAPPPTGGPAVPQTLLSAAYTCPTQGRFLVVVTGRLQQSPLTHFESWYTQLSISRNSTNHASTTRIYDAPDAGTGVGAEDVAMQHLSTCDAGQTVTFRLLGNKGRNDQQSPTLLDAALSVLFIASSSPVTD
jgi:hypothetical protein